MPVKLYIPNSMLLELKPSELADSMIKSFTCFLSVQLQLKVKYNIHCLLVIVDGH